MWKVPLFDLDYDSREKDAVQSVLDSKWLAAGPRVAEFEEKFSDYLGGIHCCAVSNCTAALHMALAVAGIGPGDEVILPGLTFVADLNVVTLCGASPVLADSISLADWNISVEDIAAKITPATKAVIVVHFAGYPCDMEELCSLCRDHDLLLIEDTAHAVGGAYGSEKCGAIGDVGCFSFFSNKNLSTGEGGMLVSHNEEFVQQARLFRSHGMTSLTYARHQGSAMTYDVVRPGLNYRLDEIRAALGIVQLAKLDGNNKRRQKIVEHYRDGLKMIPQISVPWQDLPSAKLSSYHIFPVVLPEGVNRCQFMEFLKEKGIQTSIHYPAFAKFSWYGSQLCAPLPTADRITARGVTLPLYPAMSEKDVSAVLGAVAEYFKELEEKT